MFQHAEYHHPQVDALFGGSWREVFFSWVIAVATVGGVLLSL